LERRCLVQRALVSVMVTSCLLGMTTYLLGLWTRWARKLVEQQGIKHMPRSRVSEMARCWTFRWRRAVPGPLEALPVRSGGWTR
jgi:hypothetical protein